MKEYLVLGTGMMGIHIAKDLARNGGLVTLADFDPAKEAAARNLGLPFQQTDVTDHNSLVKLMENYDVAISAVDHNLHLYGLKAAIDARCDFCDLGADPTTLKNEFKLHQQAKEAGITAAPDQGVCPGTTNILIGMGDSKLDTTDYIHYFVGGVPLEPKPTLNYTLIFSVKVLLNEYFENVEIIKDGKLCQVEGMSGLEEITFPGFGKMEAAHVAGATSSLTRTFLGKVRELYEKTIRYPGHYQKIKELAKRFKTRKELENHLLSVLPKQDKDALLLKVVVGGKKDGQDTKITYSMADKYRNGMTAMARTTAWPASIVAQMIANGKITQKGVLESEIYVPRQEFIDELDRRGVKIKEEVIQNGHHG